MTEELIKKIESVEEKISDLNMKLDNLIILLRKKQTEPDFDLNKALLWI